MQDTENPYASSTRIDHRDPDLPLTSTLDRGAPPPRSPIRPLWIVLALLAVPMLWPLFYRPGSSLLEDVAVRGRLTNADGLPLTDLKVELTLPASYGLSASEARTPARFGNATRFASVTTDSAGGFSHSFGSTVYHVDNFYIPFHVRIPKRAPALRFYMRVPSFSSELYEMEAREGIYWVRSQAGRLRSAPSAPIDSFTIREELSRPDGIPLIEAIVELQYASGAENIDVAAQRQPVSPISSSEPAANTRSR